MGVSLAMVFHVTSSIVVLLLAGWGLRLQRDLRFLRAMIAIAKVDGSDQPVRRVADIPERFICRMARVFAVPVSGRWARSGSGSKSGLTAIMPASLAQMFLRDHVSLIHFADSRTVEIYVASRRIDAASQAELLARSFGGSVQFKILEAGENHAR